MERIEQMQEELNEKAQETEFRNEIAAIREMIGNIDSNDSNE